MGDIQPTSFSTVEKQNKTKNAVQAGRTSENMKNKKQKANDTSIIIIDDPRWVILIPKHIKIKQNV